MTTPVASTFQDLVRRLTDYWAGQGCLVWQPHNAEVGAGTMNPATYLFVLGPEPWNVVYLEPSVRPDDARYGENPNRVGRHHQLQVILKPDPGDPQQLYLNSLTAIGIDLTKHDVRFVEDNWESPALGAWGLGWEVWLDGLEITQFTYFQQAGSIDLEPNSVEITYGLERIAMALQDVAHFKDLRWNEHTTFGQLVMDYEQQTSRYYFELADVDRLRQMYELYDAEARAALDADLVRVAHDYTLKCSHIFNVLDARGTIGVTERARYFGRMRELARLTAHHWVAQRRELEHPLLHGDTAAWVAGAAAAADAPTLQPPTASTAATPPTEPADFVLEVGVEELPPADLTSALQALADRIPPLLADHRLTAADVVVEGTPRRLLVTMRALAPSQTALEEHVVGPPASAAFAPDGRPTPAAEGFARKLGVDVSALETVERGGELRVAAVRREAGRAAGEVLAEALPAVLGGLPFARGMRWNASRQPFSRPVRWIVALHGNHIVPLAFAGLVADRTTHGIRPAGSPAIALASAEDHRKLMRTIGVPTSPVARRDEILRQVAAAASAAGGHVPDDQGLLDEVAGLVEQPRAFVGRFDEAYLALPDVLLVTVMRKHQRYFPVRAADGRLLPAFIAVANGARIDEAAVRHGNEAVLRARFADAAYFWAQDRKHPLDTYTPKLSDLMFQSELGSILDKVERLERLMPALADYLGVGDEALATARRAAALAKSDLVTSMVTDFTSLQGAMGREYARLSGESEDVATAIYEHYLPRGGGDGLPTAPAGTLLAIADRLDSLIGLFAVGLKPTGAQDPYGLRRAALGIMRLLSEGVLSFDDARHSVTTLIDEVAAQLPVPASPTVKDDVAAFIATRFEVQLRDRGHAPDTVSAVLAVLAARPKQAVDVVRLLERQIAEPGWPVTLTAYARCARIVRGRDTAERLPTFDEAASRLTGPQEQALIAAIRAAGKVDGDDASGVFGALARLAAPVNAFFEGVLVMDEDLDVRAARLAIVRWVADLPRNVADLSKLEGF
ncbi:MAG: glycine--tRNA ligase subunit beta [Ardenticatenales bacterium]|nr:glycine--tRNA ligase subunit beta [Ardenticatenales bacterium]